MTTCKWLAILTLAIGLAGVLTACAGTTPAGALGSPIDLRSALPADVAKRAPAPGDAAIQSAQARVKAGNPAATVQIAWKTFKDGSRAYVLNVAFSVIEPAEGLELSATTEGAPIYVGTSDRSNQAVRVVITWSRRSVWGAQTGTVAGMILADGRWEPAQ